MPGVTLQPNSPSFSGLDPLHPSPSDKQADYANAFIADIKTKAKEAVFKEANRASPLSLIHIAQNQILSAKEKESTGDLRGALESYIKTATLLKLAMDSAELKQDKTKGGPRKEFQDFLNGTGRDLSARTQSVEERLKTFAANKQANIAETKDEPVNKSFGGTIADRMKALQEHGLSIGPTTKRLSREVSSLSSPPPPLSPTQPSGNSVQSLPSTVIPNVPSTSVSSTQSSHTFVPTSSFGPPSPASSPSSSPQLHTMHSSTPFDLSGFAASFPPIDELDENPAFTLPSVPTGPSSIPPKPSIKDFRNDDAPLSPTTSNFRNFGIHIERPSSTPLTPITNVFNSRPASPTRANAPIKPSALSSSTATPANTPPAVVKPPIPTTNVTSPKELQAYMRDHNVLVIDVRNRADFDREHIKAQAIVCIEPTVLMRENMTAETLEDSMVIAPKGEASLFANRDKFDIVAVYDESSKKFGSADTAPSILVRVIHEQAFKKILKRMPMLLMGGMEAWKQDLGGAEVVRGEGFQAVSGLRSPPLSGGLSAPLSPVPSPPSPKNPFMNGLVSSPSLGGNNESQTQFNPFRGTATMNGDHRPSLSLDHTPSHSRSPAEINYTGNAISNGALQRRPAIVRVNGSSISQNGTSSSFTNGGVGPISYPQFPARISPATSGSSATAFVTPPDITSPPRASINPSPFGLRRNDYFDATQDPMAGTYNHTRSGPIDYPELLPKQSIIQAPPPVVAPALERQDNRPRVPAPPSALGVPRMLNGAPKAPRIESDFPVTYWLDTPVGLSGLKNLGNTCYMNAPIQCLSATVPFARFFTEHRWKNAINYMNPLGSKGRLTTAFAKLLYEMWGGDMPYLTPIEFRKSICQLRSQYDNSDQHDSQEFLSFLMDGIHEDLNRVMMKPVWAPTPEQEAELERLPPQIASEREWRAWKARNDSLIVDYFQGQFRNRLECLTCHQTSTTYNVFSALQLPIPHGRNGRVPIERCLEAFFNEEILEKDDAWDCPKCKTKRRASKRLSLARLPPVLIIHLKRFEANGRFSDKVDTFVEYPMKSLDLTNYMPAPLPPGADKSELNGGLPMSLDDPRTQLPPYRYDLYGVTNHFGNLTSGHYTAFIASRGGWMYCDDSSIKAVDPKDVVNQKAYVLFYKRVRS